MGTYMYMYMYLYIRDNWVGKHVYTRVTFLLHTCNTRVIVIYTCTCKLPLSSTVHVHVVHVYLSFRLSVSVIHVGSLSVVMPAETESVSLSAGVVMERWTALTGLGRTK